MLPDTPPPATANGPGWTLQRTGSSLTASFVGHLNAEQGAESIEQFVRLLGQDRCRVVFDIRKMTGYDSGARRAWATALRPLRSRLESIELVGGNAMVRMGGTVLGAMIGVPVTGRR